MRWWRNPHHFLHRQSFNHMNHKYIDDLDIIDRYLMGNLPADESEHFEEHFVSCSRCADQMEANRDLIQGLRLVASQESSEVQSGSLRGPTRYSRHVVSRRWLALASAFLLLVAVVGAIAISRIRLSMREADQAKSVATEWEHRYEEEQQSASLIDEKHQETERELAAELNRLRAELENKRTQAQSDIARQYAFSVQPQINLPIIGLQSARGNASQPNSTRELDLPSSPSSFVISLALEGAGGYKAYRMTILSDGREIWERGGLKPNQYNSLLVGFNSTFFRNGNYVLTVEGIAGDDRTSVVGMYFLRVLKRP